MFDSVLMKKQEKKLSVLHGLLKIDLTILNFKRNVVLLLTHTVCVTSLPLYGVSDRISSIRKKKK